MTRITYVNGAYLPEEDAKISIFDRGFLMADGVYEVTAVLNQKLIDFDGHMKRLARSLNELDMLPPCPEAELLEIHRALIQKNNLHEGLIYMQVTRGVADRDFTFPPLDTKPTLVLFTQYKKLPTTPAEIKEITIISVEDMRWARCDIKTIQLLYPSLGKMLAKAQGVDDAWMIKEGYVTEGTSNNAYIIKGRQIITRPASNDILNGITRRAVFRFAENAQLEILERPFSLDEAKAADEAFITSAITFIQPVIEIDGAKIGTGKAGPLVRKLHELYLEESLKAAI